MNIIFSSDDNYAPLLGVAIYSLLENNKSYKGKINIYILDRNISKINKERMNSVASPYESKIYFINTEEIHKKLCEYINLEVRSMATWYRIFLPTLLSTSIKKVIYMDCDSYINASIIDLWNVNLDGYDIAGVLDTISHENKAAIGLNHNDAYFNAGLLVINLEKWREDNLQQKMIDFIVEKEGKVTYHDQGTINAVCTHKKVIHPKFNAMTPFFVLNASQLKKYHSIDNYYTNEEISTAKNNPVFCHLTPYLVDRPWARGNFHPLKKAYNNLVNNTPWKGLITDTPTVYLENWKKMLFHYSPFWLFLIILEIRNRFRTNLLIRKLFRKKSLT